MGFTLIGGKHWTGGHNYLRNLLIALSEHQADLIKPILFAPIDFEKVSDFENIPGVEVVRSKALSSKQFLKQHAQALSWGRVPSLECLWGRHKVDVVFEVARYFGWRQTIPTIAWIPDLQHHFLPNLFSRPAWLKREVGYRVQAGSGREIMLSSEDARLACERFYPSAVGHTHKVNFTVPPPKLNLMLSPRTVADKYGLPANFIFMPNQFWQHKNHFLVIRALTILKKLGKNVVVVASGYQNDPRAPNHIAHIISEIDRNDLKYNMKLLGLIPYSDLLCLMATCQALLNPSLFEGWSTTVEEARAIGTPMLLSDIAVHREQMGAKAKYFSPFLPEDLANVLGGMPAFDAIERDRNILYAHEQAAHKFKVFAQDFVRLAYLAIERFR